jgi:hypothetical protein
MLFPNHNSGTQLSLRGVEDAYRPQNLILFERPHHERLPGSKI